MRRWALLALVILTIAPRMAFIVPTRLQMAANPIRSAEVELAAISLLEHGELGNVYHDPTGPTAHVSPLYPLIVAAIYAVFGPNTLASMLVQSLLATATLAATLALLPGLARRLNMPEAVGWIAAFGLAILPINWYYESFGDWEQPTAALVMVALVICFLDLRQANWQRPWLIVAAGALTGVAALLSPSLVPAVALMLLAEFVWTNAPRKRVFAGGVCVVAISLVMAAPWMVRNYYSLGGFVPLRSNFGLELWFGNRDDAVGHSNIDWSDPDMSNKLRHPHPNAAECQKLKDMGEIAYMKSRQAEAVEWIRENPGRFAELTALRVRLFWFPDRGLFNNSSLATTVKIVGFATISVLMFLGLLRLAWRRNGVTALLIAAIFGATLIYMITHFELRYRLPIHALMGLIAADFVVAMVLAFLGAVKKRPAASVPAMSEPS